MGNWEYNEKHCSGSGIMISSAGLLPANGINIRIPACRIEPGNCFSINHGSGNYTFTAGWEFKFAQLVITVKHLFHALCRKIRRFICCAGTIFRDPATHYTPLPLRL